MSDVMVPLDSSYMISYCVIITMSYKIVSFFARYKTSNLSKLAFGLSTCLRSLKCDGAIRLPIYDFLLIFNSNICPNSVPLWDITHQNMSDCDLPRSLKVECDGGIEVTIYDFILEFHSNIWPNYRLEFEWPWLHLSRSLKIKSHDVIGFPICDFLLVSKSNHTI